MLNYDRKQYNKAKEKLLWMTEHCPELMQLDQVANVSVSSDMMERIGSMLAALDIIVVVVILCAAGLAWGLGLSLAEGGVLLLFSLAFAGFTALMGLAVNLLFPKLDAVNDMVVVKQSAAAMLSTFGGMIGALACGGAVWALTDVVGELPALAGCAAVLLLACLAGAWILILLYIITAALKKGKQQ